MEGEPRLRQPLDNLSLTNVKGETKLMVPSMFLIPVLRP